MLGSNKGSLPSSEGRNEGEDSQEDEGVVMNRPGIRILKMEGESDDSSEEGPEEGSVGQNLGPGLQSGTLGKKSTHTLGQGKSKFASKPWSA